MARSFNGSSEYIDFGTSLWTPLIAGGGNLTVSISLWFNATTLTNVSHTVFGANSGGINALTVVILSNATVQLISADQFANVEFSPTSGALSTATWYHFAGTFAGSGSGNPCSIAAYINGVSLGTPGSQNFYGYSSTSDPNFRAGADSVINYFNGRVADIAVWSVVLSSSEITGLSRGIRPNLIRPLSLLRWWPFAGLQSPEPDLSGNKNNGTLTGTQPVFGPPLGLATPMIHGRTIPQFPPPPPPIYSVAGFAYAEW